MTEISFCCLREYIREDPVYSAGKDFFDEISQVTDFSDFTIVVRKNPYNRSAYPVPYRILSASLAKLSYPLHPPCTRAAPPVQSVRRHYTAKEKYAAKCYQTASLQYCGIMYLYDILYLYANF